MSNQAAFWDATDFDYTFITFVGLTNGVGMLLGYFGAGLTSDRWSKKSLVQIQVMSMAVLSALVVGLVLTIGLEGDWFYAVAAIFGIAHGMAAATILGWIGDLLPRRLIAKGVVIHSLAWVPEGVLLTLPSTFFQGESDAAPWLFAIGGALYALTALTVTKVMVKTEQRSSGQSPISELIDALTYMWRDARLKPLLVYALIASVVLIFLEAALSDFLLVENELDTLDNALAYVARGIAGFVCSIALIFIISGRHRWRLFVGATVVLGFAVIVLCITTNIAVLIPLMILVGGASTIIFLSYRALALSTTRSGYFGRVAALLLFVIGLPNIGAGFVSAFFYDWFDGRYAVLVIGLLLTLPAAWFYRRWLRFRHLPENPDIVERSLFPNMLEEASAPQKPTV